MKCAKCQVSVFDAPLRRINPKGEKVVWWCDKCLSEHEPELLKNEKEDESQVEKDLRDIFYPPSK